MTIRVLAATAVVISLGAVSSSVNWAQDGEALRHVDEWKLKEAKIAVEAQRAAVEEAAKASTLAAAAVKGERIKMRKFMSVPFVQARHLTDLEEIAERYSNGEDEQEKAKALKELRDRASQYFEEDMEVRQKELQDIERRLEKLRAQLERRRVKKDEIVDLQVKVAIYNAEGLGFTSAPRESFNFDIRVPAPVMVGPNAPKFGEFDVLTTRTLPSDVVPPPTRVEVPIPSPPTPPADNSLESDSPTLGIGAKGDAVRLLQKVLNKRLDPSPELNIDGDFGPETDKALRLFQSEHDLEVSGVVDEATKKELDLPEEMPPFIKY